MVVVRSSPWSHVVAVLGTEARAGSTPRTTPMIAAAASVNATALASR